MQNKIQISLVERFQTASGDVLQSFDFKKFIVHYPVDATYKEKVTVIKKEIERFAPSEVLQEFVGFGFITRREKRKGIYVLKLVEPINIMGDADLEVKRLELLLLNNPKYRAESMWIEKMSCEPLMCTKLSIAIHRYDGW